MDKKQKRVFLIRLAITVVLVGIAVFILAKKWNRVVDPFVISKTEITSKLGMKTYGEFIVIPKTAKELVSYSRKRVLKEIKEAIRLAKRRGAKIVGLGAYTSVVSRSGLAVKDEGVPLTTGNSYTIVAAVEAINKVLVKLKERIEDITVAVIGATGTIGQGLSLLIAEKAGRLILLGNAAHKRSSMRRLYRIRGRIYKYLANIIKDDINFKVGSIGYKLAQRTDLPDYNAPLKEFIKFAERLTGEDNLILLSTEIDRMLPQARVIISATSSVDRLIKSDNLQYGAIICDISRPRNVSEELCQIRPDILVIDGGVIQLPGSPSLGWYFGFDQGLAYACMSEAMMLSLEEHYQHTSLGLSGINLNSILLTRRLAYKHGFKLAQFRSFDQPLIKKRWDQIIKIRRENRV